MDRAQSVSGLVDQRAMMTRRGEDVLVGEDIPLEETVPPTSTEVPIAVAEATNLTWSLKSMKEMAHVNNFNILLITAILFGVFVVAEVVGALASNSLSLLGDAAAMSVDVFTYMTNMYAERTKAKYGKIEPNTLRALEVYIPTFSVLALLGVTGWIASDAVIIIIQEESGQGAGDDVDVVVLFAFAAVNFVIDAVSSFMFYVRRKNVLLAEHVHTFEGDQKCVECETPSPAPAVANLNMVSALTHVGSDTLRTLSVFTAAVVSSAGRQSSSLCDAWAALVVTSTIVVAVVPLCKEIYKAAVRIPTAPAQPSDYIAADMVVGLAPEQREESV